MKKIIRRLFNIFGLEISKHNILPIDRFFMVLQYMKFYPLIIVDVGANKGEWTRRALKYFPNSRFLMLEPQEWLKENFVDLLGRKNIEFYGVGAGSKSGVLKFSISKNDVSSSFKYDSNEPDTSILRQIDVPVVRLDELIEKPLCPDIVKIDAEGFDFEVLEGLGQHLGQAEVILIEAAVVFKGFSNSLIRIVNYMDEKGYNLFDITDFNRPPTERVLWLVELAFVKKNGQLDSFAFEYK